jgi:hypothetical protein
MQCRAANCNPTFARSDIFDIGRLLPHVCCLFDLRARQGGVDWSAVQKMGAGLGAAITPSASRKKWCAAIALVQFAQILLAIRALTP